MRIFSHRILQTQHLHLARRHRDGAVTESLVADADGQLGIAAKKTEEDIPSRALNRSNKKK